MNRCPITYALCGDQFYSLEGLKLLSKRLKYLKLFPYTPKEQIQLASQLATKLSIQGIQPKLSVLLDIAQASFKVVERGGQYILKPPHPHYDEIPQNEDLTMKLAAAIGIEVSLHGLLYNIDHSLTYFIKRFDRLPRNQKLAVEDFSQLLGFSRETKYESSMEQVASVIEKYCTFPVIEKLRLFRLFIFNFLIGNEDMHLKNFSLIRRNHKVELSPAYDLLNTTIILRAKEEIALPLKGKKSRLNRGDFVDYFGQERLRLTEAVIQRELSHFESALPRWKALIEQSFLSSTLQQRYWELVESRWHRLLKS
jgi:serine/threonine-protein kinase HipA